MTVVPLFRRPLALPASLVDFEVRGFSTEPVAVRRSLEAAARAFLDGYHAELAGRANEPPDLSSVPPDRRGFAAEGAAMAASVLLSTRRSRVLHEAYDDRYAYLMHIGHGWAMAKLHRRRPGPTGVDAPLLRWLAYDGMGFCQEFFARRRRRHPAVCPPTCAIRHQGVGRALWFRGCGDPATVAAHASRLPERHGEDVWSGIGLAATYAGGVSPACYDELAALARDNGAALAQGAAFAAEARRLAGETPPHTVVAVGVLAGATPERAAEWTWAARRGLDRPGAGAAAYQSWRHRVQQMAAAEAGRPA
jgi:enediyne biosynthesis protein E3